MALDLSSRQIRGLDALDLGSAVPPRAHAVWRAAWPKLAALAIVMPTAFQKSWTTSWWPSSTNTGTGPGRT